jgi:predicted secreted protein
MHDESDEPKPTAAEDPKDQTAEDQESPEDEVPDAAETSDDPAAQDDEATEETARWAPPEDGTPTTEQTVDPYENAPGSDSANTGPQPNDASAAPQGSGPDPQAAGPYQQDPYQQAPYQQAPYQQVPHQQGPYQSGPVPYPAPPGYPANAPKSKFASALAKGATWKTALIPPGIALLGGIIVSIILTVILTSMSEFDSLTEETGLNLDSLNYALPFILMALSLFGSAALRLDINAPDSFNAQLSIFTTGAPLVVTIVIVGLLWWMTKISERRSPAPNRVSTWIRIGVATLAMTLVLFLFQVIFAARASALEEEGSFTFSFSAVTARSFFLPLLVILITSIAGRVAGHFKGTEAIGAPFLRWAVPPLLVTWIHFALTVAVFSIVALFVLPLSVEMPGQLVPLTFVNMGLILTSLTHLGGISATAQGDLGFYSDTFSESLTLFSREAPGLLWLGLLVVAVTVLIATVVATVTRRPAWTVIEQDKQQWSSAWKLPVAFCLVWGLLSLLAIPANMSMSGSAEAAMFFGGSGAARAGIGPLAWTFLIFALWGGIIEVLSRTLGPRLALTFPAVARIAAGRTVHPHWGPYLGMSEPQFAFVHPDLAQAAAPAPPPVAPGPGEVGPQGPAGYQGQPASPDAFGSQGQGQGQPQAHPGSQPGSHPGATQQGPPPPPTPSGQQAYAWPQGSAGQQSYSAPQGMYAAQPYAGPAQPFDKKKAKLVSVVAGGAALLLVAAIIVVTQLNGHMFGPEATVEKYFSELSDGDAEGALKVADVDVPQESRTLLTNDVLGGSKALPDDVTVEDAEISGDTATVAVTYDVGGSKGNSTLTLHKAGKKALFFDDWALKSPDLLTLTVDTPGLKKVKVNGIDVDSDGSTLSLPAFPGLYTIDLAERSDLITADAVEVRAFLGDDANMEGEETPLLAAHPSDAFRTEVDKQVKTLIDSCAKKSVAQPDGCPFGSSLAESYDATGLTWSISSYPTVTVADDSLGADQYSNPEDATGPNGGPAWLISSNTSGEALVTGTYDMFDESEPFDDTVSFDLNGTAEIVDGKIVITVNDDPWDW